MNRQTFKLTLSIHSGYTATLSWQLVHEGGIAKSRIVHSSNEKTMRVYQLRHVAMPNGHLTASSFGRKDGTWEDRRLVKARPLAAKWQPARLQLLDPERRPTAVLFSRNAVALDATASKRLRHFRDIELLPIEIEPFGIYNLLHITAVVEFPVDSQFRKGSLFGEPFIRILTLPKHFEPGHQLFRFQRSSRTIFGTAETFIGGIYMDLEGAKAIESACAGFLYAREIPQC